MIWNGDNIEEVKKFIGSGLICWRIGKGIIHLCIEGKGLVYLISIPLGFQIKKIAGRFVGASN